jgi:hypothetical protein
MQAMQAIRVGLLHRRRRRRPWPLPNAASPDLLASPSPPRRRPRLPVGRVSKVWALWMTRQPWKELGSRRPLSPTLRRCPRASPRLPPPLMPMPHLVPHPLCRLVDVPVHGLSTPPPRDAHAPLPFLPAPSPNHHLPVRPRFQRVRRPHRHPQLLLPVPACPPSRRCEACSAIGGRRGRAGFREVEPGCSPRGT